MWSELRRERVLFHLHTTVTDGESRVEEYFQHARKHDYTMLVFIEHIKREPTYDPIAFIEAVRNCENGNWDGVRAKVGFEAAIEEGGDLSIPRDAYEAADLIGLAEHRLDVEFIQYMQSMIVALKRYKDKQRIWLHPGKWLKDRKQLFAQFLPYKALLELAVKEGWYIEQNARHDLIPANCKKLVPRQKLIAGVDSHSVAELR